MANDPQFRVQDDRFEGGTSVPAEPKKRSALSTCLTGCLVVFVVTAILAALAIWWTMRNWRDLASNFGSAAIKQTFNESGLPADEVTDLNLQVDRLATAFRENKISAEEMSKFFEDFFKSPLLTTIMSAVIDKQYLERSGLSDEEKAEARVTIQRFMRGSIDDKINTAERDKAMAPVMETKADGTKELRKTLTDAELTAFLKNAKEAADAAGVPVEVEATDPSDEFKRLVDKTLGEGAAEAPAEENAPSDVAEPAEEAAPAN